MDATAPAAWRTIPTDTTAKESYPCRLHTGSSLGDQHLREWDRVASEAPGALPAYPRKLGL